MELAIVLDTDVDNPVAGDLRLTKGTLFFSTDLADQVRQRLTVRFRFWKRELFSNLDAGTPWLDAIFEKGVPDSAIKATLSAVILGCKGVTALDSITLSRTADRTLEVALEARLADGSTFSTTTYGPFVVAAQT